MPRAKSFEEEVAYYQQKRERTLELVRAAFGASAAVRAYWGGKYPREEMWILSEDTHPVPEGQGRPWRISRFGKDGPFGHDVAASRAAVIEMAGSEWAPHDATPMTEEQVLEWTGTAEYQQGVKHVAFMQAINSLSWHISKHPANEAQLRAMYDEAWKVAHGGDIERATEIAERALRGRANPPVQFVQNPPWITKAIADNYEKIVKEMGITYLPQFGDVRHRGERISFSVDELGCGAYGCVLPTVDYKVVLKVTTDASEMDFVMKILPELPAMITTKYFAWMWTRSRHNIKTQNGIKPMRIGFLWREAADYVGGIHKAVPEERGIELLKAIKAQHEAASNCLMAVLRDQYGALPGLLAVWQALCAKMARLPELEFVGRGMLEAYEQQGVFFADVHEGNLGRVQRDGKPLWVITDPGNVIVIGDEAEAVDEGSVGVDAAELEELRRIFNVNPGGRDPERLPPETFVCMDRHLHELGRSITVEGAMAKAPPGNTYALVRGEYTSDGTHWGLGRGRQVAVREMGPSGFRWYRDL